MERGLQPEIIKEEQLDLLEAFGDQEITIYGVTGTFTKLASMCPLEASDLRFTLEKKNDFVVKFANEAGLAVDAKYEQQFAETLERHGIERKFTVKEPALEPITKSVVEADKVSSQITDKIAPLEPRIRIERHDRDDLPNEQTDGGRIEAVAIQLARNALVPNVRGEMIGIAELDTHYVAESDELLADDIRIPDEIITTVRPKETETLISEPPERPPSETVQRLDAAETVGIRTTDVVRNATDKQIIQATNTFTEQFSEDTTPGTASVTIDARGFEHPAEHDEQSNIAPEVITIETLLDMEAIPVMFEASADNAERPSEAPPFSEQIETLIAQTIELDRQAMVETMLERVYDLIDEQIIPAADWQPAAAGQAETTVPTPEIGEELEAIVALVLQELGVAEPTAEQIERFISLVRADRAGAGTASGERLTYEADAQERAAGLTNDFWRRYTNFLRLHRPLGELALLPPAA